MKITGRIEVFKGEKGLVAKATAFNGQGKATGSLYLPIFIDDLEVQKNETWTIDLVNAYLNVVTSKTAKGEKFTHFCINVKEYKIVKTYKGE